ncbi:AraC family transcriptional regulator [Anaerosinus massiliensis]|uniref:AraC family transcriptional regulator n=1 Tax=Massilibacillus massiliensis TaxID=1806837 RepID=UPI000B15BAB2|nr:helix-turn-helix domain-containing protein [Massilibacillus massiliensis]
MELKETIAECLRYIEDNLYKKINLDDIAVHCGMSKYHLHRMFKSLTGESLMEYVQSRKLSSSLSELKDTSRRIIDIAMDYGFDYEQSYIRAFRKKFGFTPLKIRSEPVSLVIQEKLNIDDIMSVNNSVIYKPSFMFKQKFYLVGVKHKILSKSGDRIANSYGKKFFYQQSHQITNPVDSQVYFGYTDWRDSENGCIYYMPSLQVHDLKQVPKHMEGVVIPAHNYVIFHFVGFFRPDDINGRQIGRLLVHMYSKWIFNSGYKFADTFRFEYINNHLCKDHYCELDIYQPIIDANKI